MTSSVSLNVPTRFQAAFEEASRTTGAKFDYLVQTAKRESGLNATAKAPTSSATGLFQFVEQTWLQTMKEDGPALGFGNVASQISKSGSKYVVEDPKVRQQILDMRNDPKASAMLAGALAQKNEASLSDRLNRTPSSGELYAAHFLGAQGSGRLIELAEDKPNLEAYKVFPQQAAANRNIFYERSGEAKTVSEVYENLTGTVPETKKSALSRFFNLGNWFKPKDSMQESRFAQKEDASSTVAPSAQSASTQVALPAGVIDLAGDNVTVADKVTVTDNVRSSRTIASRADATKPDAFFSNPDQARSDAMPSRYGMAYRSSSDAASLQPQSRFAPDTSSSATSAINNRVSRVFADYAAETAPKSDIETSSTINKAQSAAEAVESQPTTQQASAAMPLPKRKPISADAYVDALAGALPRPKPSATSSSSSSSLASQPLDLTSTEQGSKEEASSRDVARRRFGALDLTAFLDSDVVNTRKNS